MPVSPEFSARVYDAYDKAFVGVSAYAVLREGVLVARVVFKRGTSGMVSCYLHFLGEPMTRGRAGGGGYDKHSAAFNEATARIAPRDESAYVAEQRAAGHAAHANDYEASRAASAQRLAQFRAAALAPNPRGGDWWRALESAGYSVAQVV